MKNFKMFVMGALSLAFASVAFAQEKESPKDGDILGEYGAITVKMLNGKRTAVISSESKETVEITENVEIDSVYYDRDYSGEWGKPGTIMLPFSMDIGCMSASAQISEIVEIAGTETYQIYAQNSNGKFVANTPYFVRPSQNRLSFGNHCFPVTMNTTKEGNMKSAFGNWVFTGSYTYKKWETGDADLGYVYGFAAKAKEVDGKQIQQGQFVKGKAGAYVRPLRAYLIYKQSAVKAKAVNGAETASIDAADLPSNIDVIFLDEEGNTTGISTLNTFTGALSDAKGWYDMKGRKLSKKPTVKGTYFYNGKKTVIK